ncbi:ATPase V0 complex c/d subunit [Arabidopsis suecica]|uniref:ATPase V0 complex c/d subunit n=1 Tax=Arabidopsis suecica TaxID=45249 RepID=A0A8T2BRK1_ARASU|nr:ATPase V0 complex c/d subunit [Arabidopsis suecica]KAG7588636.1 ATPase V0 complex c/d subunit [Arabidopsis suecica]
MIDNVVLIVTGTLHERDVQKLLEKCHPLGMFDSIDTLVVAQNMRELYRIGTELTREDRKKLYSNFGLL